MLAHVTFLHATPQDALHNFVRAACCLLPHPNSRDPSFITPISLSVRKPLLARCFPDVLGCATCDEFSPIRTLSPVRFLANVHAQDPPTWLLAHSSDGWTLRGWPSTLPTNKAISAWPTGTLLSILSMLLTGTILLVLPSPTQPDMETIVRAPQDVEPPVKRPRRASSIGAGSRAGSVWGSEYGGSDTEEMEVLGMLEPTRDDIAQGVSPVPTDTNASGTVPPESPRGDDDTTLAASASPSSSKLKAKGRKSGGSESIKSRMKAKPSTKAGPRIVLADADDGEESEAVSSELSSSEEEEEEEETPEAESPAASTATTSKKHKRSESSATAGGDAPPAKKHRRSRSGLDPEERARLLEEKVCGIWD